MKKFKYEMPAGELWIAEISGRICAVSFSKINSGQELETPVIKEAKKQLDEYFAKKRENFNLPVELIGTEFQKTVWEALMTIPYGSTVTYKELALKINKPNAQRAVGMANHNNKIAIIIPCHRVIGSNGTLTGYAAGLEMKKFLLNLEGISI